jgi:hypothetical protein
VEAFPGGRAREIDGFESSCFASKWHQLLAYGAIFWRALDDDPEFSVAVVAA